MESTINSMISFAIACISSKNEIKQENKIKEIYENYLSQFGPMVIQLGMRSALAVYQNKNEGRKGKREYILDLIFEVLKEPDFPNIAQNANRTEWINAYLVQTTDIDAYDEQLILDASVALKRAIRTFSLTDDKQE